MINTTEPALYLHPELSLLSFNERVLNMALDTSMPLLERLRFLTIFSANMDEFFEIRVSGLKAQADSGIASSGADGLTAQAVLEQINEKTHALTQLQYDTLNQQILPELIKQGIRFLKPSDWNNKQKKWLSQYFKNEVLPLLTPIQLDPAHPFPLTINKGLGIIVDLHDPDRDKSHNIAVVPVPRALPRFVRIPEDLCDAEYEYVYLSSIINDHIKKVFSNVKVLGSYQFRLTRNSDLYVDLEEVEDLARTLEGELPSRLYGEAIRLEVSSHCPKRTIKLLQDRFQLADAFVFSVDGPVNLNRLINLPDQVNRANLKYPGFTPSIHDDLHLQNNIFNSIRKKDILLHHPFESFTPVIDLLRQAANDPDVLVIKQTLYRIGANSIITELLANAARAGKEVTVVIELMARFDEQNNLSAAQMLQEAGAHVVYGMVGKKTHAKLLMVVRKEAKSLRRYVHVGTGNYHTGNTRTYTDYGLFTTNKKITSDVHEIFLQLTTQGPNPKLEKLSQSPFGIRDMIIANIDREIAHARAGKKAHIIGKMNGLSSPQIIEALYRASQSGVQIDLIVRGICCLIPGIAGVSENIRVRSIIGRFLEHDRVYYFLDDGNDHIYLSSADWMPRNMQYRIEQCTPIDDEGIHKRILTALHLYIKDNTDAWLMQSDGSYRWLKREQPETRVCAQGTLLSDLSEKL